MVDDLSKAAVVGALLKIDVGNPNAGWPEGIVTVIKKVERPDGKTHPYISGQALRRYIRDTLKELKDVKAGEFSPLKKTEKKKAPTVTEGDPKKYLDDDLFGYMLEDRRRESPLRVAPAFGLFPYTGDRDLGTKSYLEVTGELGGAMFETELTNNLFRTVILLELDRVGTWKGYEAKSEKEMKVPEKERQRRASLLFESLKYLWGGARRTRFLVDLTPQFIVYARMKQKVPLFLHALQVDFKDGNYVLRLEPLHESVKDYKESIQKLVIGIREGSLGNLDAIKKFSVENLDIEISSVGGALDKMRDDICKAKFASSS